MTVDGDMKSACKIILCAIFLMFVPCVTGFCQDYPKLKELSDNESILDLSPAEKKGKWGYVDQDGKFRIKACFDRAEDFIPTVFKGDTVFSAKISYEGKYGCLSDMGVFLILPEYDFISHFDRGTAVFSKDGSYGMADASGRILVSGFDAVMPFDDYGIAWVSQGGLWGAYDLFAGKVFDICFSSMPEIRYGSLMVVENAGSLGLVSMKDRRIVFECSADEIFPDASDADLLILKKGQMRGCVGSDGTLILPLECEMISGGHDGGKILFRKSGKYGLCDKTGRMLIPPVMNTDQVSSEARFYKFFDRSSGFQVPVVHFDGNTLSLKDFDDKVFSLTGNDGYLENEFAVAGDFPQWLMQHRSHVLPMPEFMVHWVADNSYVHPGLGEAPFVQDPSGVPAGEGIHVVIGRDKKVCYSDGLGLEAGSVLGKAVMRIDTLDVPCGSWLAPLMSVSHDKVAAYDRAMGTSVGKDWQYVTAKVRNRGIVPDGDVVAVVDVLLDSLLMQRHIVKFSTKGLRRSCTSLDGILYDRTGYVNDDMSRCFYTEDKFILPLCIGPERKHKTMLYEKSGKLVTELGGMFCELVIETGDVLRLLVRDEYTFSISEVDIPNRKYTMDDTGISSKNMTADYHDGHAYIYENETKSCKSIVELHGDCTVIPAVRYVRSQWDAEAVVGISANLWDVPQESAWIVVPKPLKDPRVENVNGYMVTVHPPGPDGISIYSISTNVWTNEDPRYGFIGYDADFFTQPVYEDIRDMVGGEARVKVNGEWKTINKE